MMPSITPSSSQAIPLRGSAEPALDPNPTHSEASVRLSGRCSVDMSTTEPTSNSTSWGQSVRNACCGVGESLYAFGNKFTTRQAVAAGTVIAVGGFALTAGGVAAGALLFSGAAMAGGSGCRALSGGNGASQPTGSSVTTLPTTPARTPEKIIKSKASGEASNSYACATQESSSVKCTFKDSTGKGIETFSIYNERVGILNNATEAPAFVTITSVVGNEATLNLANSTSHCFVSHQKLTAGVDTETVIKSYEGVSAADCEEKGLKSNNPDKKLEIYAANRNSGGLDPKIRCGDGYGEVAVTRATGSFESFKFDRVHGPYYCRITSPKNKATFSEVEVDVSKATASNDEGALFVCVQSQNNYKDFKVDYTMSKSDCRKKTIS